MFTSVTLVPRLKLRAGHDRFQARLRFIMSTSVYLEVQLCLVIVHECLCFDWGRKQQCVKNLSGLNTFSIEYKMVVLRNLKSLNKCPLIRLISNNYVLMSRSYSDKILSATEYYTWDTSTPVKLHMEDKSPGNYSS